MEALGINLGYLLVFTLNFFIILMVLRAWVYKPLLGMLEKRRLTVAQGLEDARIAAEARANAEKEAAEVVAEAQAKAAEIVADATKRADEVAKDIHAQAEAEAGKARSGALAELEGERNRMLAELRGQVVGISIAAAQKLIGENLDDKRQRVLLDEFFAGVKGGKVVVLEGAAVSAGQSAEVTSALPLTDAEQETVKKDVLSKLGGAATVSFRVDPAILGGLVVRLGDRVVDGSVAGQLEGLRHSLK